MLYIVLITVNYDIASHAGDNTPYSGDETTENVKLSLEKLSKLFFSGFS